MVSQPMRLLAAVTTLVVWLALAAPAFAGDNGEGLLGETTDRVVTFFCFGVLVFIALFVTVASVIQGRLEKRKEQRKAVELRRRVGW
jgi:multisubunit Na+/H+ antiporter MnhB subunit